MTPAHDIEPRICKWLAMLADVTVAGSEPVTSDRIATVAALLAKDGFPPAAFTSDSLHAVAQGQRFFPAYNDIRLVLHGWWDTHRPRHAPALAGPGGSSADLTGMDAQWFRYWHQRSSEGFGPAREGAAPSTRATVASLVRQHSPKAWAVISGVAERGVAEGPTDSAVAYVANLLRPEPEQRSRPFVAEVTPIRPAASHLIGPALDQVRAQRAGVVR